MPKDNTKTKKDNNNKKNPHEWVEDAAELPAGLGVPRIREVLLGHDSMFVDQVHQHVPLTCKTHSTI